jgi:Zn-dependent metalloprotease
MKKLFTLSFMAALLALTLTAAAAPLVPLSPLASGDKREVEIIRDPATNRPTFLLVKGVNRHHGHSAVSAERAEAIATDYLSAEGSAFGISSVESELKLERVETDQLGLTHVRYHQIYQGLPVVTGEIYVHLNQTGEVYLVSGKFAPDISLSPIRPYLCRMRRLWPVPNAPPMQST